MSLGSKRHPFEDLMDEMLDEESTSAVILLDAPTTDEIVLSIDLRHEWRGFSFGSFWFGYYFTHFAPREEVFRPV